MVLGGSLIVMTEYLAKMTTDFTIDNGPVVEKRPYGWFMGGIQHHCLDELIKYHIKHSMLLTLKVNGNSLYVDR